MPIQGREGKQTMAESGPPVQPNIVRKPEKKPDDFRATSEQQSNAGTYDERGGNRTRKVVTWIIAGVIVAVAVAIIVEVIAGVAPCNDGLEMAQPLGDPRAVLVFFFQD